MITNLNIKKSFLSSIQPRFNFILDDVYWDYILASSNDAFGIKTLWDNFNNLINEKYNGDISLFDNDVYNLLTAFERLMKIVSDKLPYISKDYYNEELHHFNNTRLEKGIKMINGNFYLSIDLKNALFQCFEKFGGFYDYTLQDFLKIHTMVPEIFDLRGVKLKCADIVIDYIGEQYMVRMALALLSQIYDSDFELIKFIKENHLKLVRINNDELIFDLGPEISLPDNIINKFCGKDFVVNDIEFHVNLYQYKLIHYTYNGTEMYKTIYDYPLSGKRKFNSDKCIYAWQLNKLYNGEELNEKDKVININGEIVPFNDEIIILKD